MSLHKAMVKVRAAEELDLLMKVASAATDLVNEVEGRGDLPPSLGAMAKLADAVHAHWKFQAS
jgi:hypothetical protein